jgi:predicted ribosomally synthesized peptide with nif11-like leader
LKLLQFCNYCDSNAELQAQVSSAASADQLVAIAAEAGFSFSVADLAKAAPELSAPYWPWAGKGFRARKAFFRGSGS